MESTNMNNNELYFMIVRRISNGYVEYLISDFFNVTVMNESVEEFTNTLFNCKDRIFHFVVNDETLKHSILGRIPRCSLLDPDSVKKSNYTWENVIEIARKVCKIARMKSQVMGNPETERLNEVGLLFYLNGFVYDDLYNRLPIDKLDPRMYTQINRRINLDGYPVEYFTRYSNIDTSLLQYFYIYKKYIVKLHYNDKIQYEKDENLTLIENLKILCNEYPLFTLGQIKEVINEYNPRNLMELHDAINLKKHQIRPNNNLNPKSENISNKMTQAPNFESIKLEDINNNNNNYPKNPIDNPSLFSTLKQLAKEKEQKEKDPFFGRSTAYYNNSISGGFKKADSDDEDQISDTTVLESLKKLQNSKDALVIDGEKQRKDEEILRNKFKFSNKKDLKTYQSNIRNPEYFTYNPNNNYQKVSIDSDDDRQSNIYNTNNNNNFIRNANNKQIKKSEKKIGDFMGLKFKSDYDQPYTNSDSFKFSSVNSNPYSNNINQSNNKKFNLYDDLHQQTLFNGDYLRTKLQSAKDDTKKNEEKVLFQSNNLINKTRDENDVNNNLIYVDLMKQFANSLGMKISQLTDTDLDDFIYSTQARTTRNSLKEFISKFRLEIDSV